MEVKKEMLRWNKVQLSLLGRISVIKVNVLSRMLFFSQTTPVLTTNVPFKQ